MANATSTDEALVISRFFAAPPALVFKAWTTPAYLTRWWAPNGCSTPHVSIDARVGGRIHYCMRMPDGVEIWGLGVYREVVAGQRLVYVDSFADAAGNLVAPTHYGMSAAHPAETLVTVTFAAEGAGTRVILRHEMPITVAERDGAEQGWSQMLERLADLLRSTASTDADDRADSSTFTITRVFDAPRDLVFKVWTQAEHLAHWWGPKGFALRVARLDARPGGIFLYSMTSATGQEMWGRFIFREIKAPERLVFVSSFSDPAGGVTRHPMAPTWPVEMLTTAIFTERAGKTEVALSSVGYQANAAERATFEAGFDSMRGGYGGTFDKLDAYLREARSRA